MTNKKKNIKYIIIVAIIILCIVFSKYIRYIFIGKNDIIISEPTSFYFEIMDKESGDLYEINDTNSEAYITVDKKYLNNDDVKIYVSGEYWNSPEIPLVKLNGKVIDNVKTDNTGYAKGVFSDTYFSKNYHFYINETIKENKEYTFYVRIKNISKSIRIIFTTIN